MLEQLNMLISDTPNKKEIIVLLKKYTNNFSHIEKIKFGRKNDLCIFFKKCFDIIMVIFINLTYHFYFNFITFMHW